MKRKNGATLIHMIFALVNRGQSCIEWPFQKQGKGYGCLYFQGRTQTAHRVAWTLVKGTIPSDKDVLHRCDNKPCFNVNHLFLGTQKDNTQDMIAKHRNRIGEQHPMAKLTEKQVEEIRASQGTFTAIGTRFRVSRHLVAKIKKGVLWRGRE